MIKRRLTILAQHLEKIARRKRPSRIFDMSWWYYTRVNPDENGCCTSACAAGEACLIPELKRLGLKLQPTDDKAPCPKYGEFNGYSALVKFFGLHRIQAEWLFDPVHYRQFGKDITPLDVAECIRHLLKASKAVS